VIVLHGPNGFTKCEANNLMIFARRVGLLVGCCLAPRLLCAQVPTDVKIVRVRVLDVRTQAAIPEVELFALNGELLARGDAAGVVRVRVLGAAGFEGELRRLGYVASAVKLTGREAGDSAVVLMAPASAQSLGTVEVRTNAVVMRYSDFDRRRLSGHAGIFLTDSEIVKGGHMKLTDLFRRFPSLKVIDSSGIYLVSSSRAKKPTLIAGKGMDLAPCIFQVVVDDVKMAWGFDMDLLNRDDIHGIEVYPGPATIPMEFASTRPDAMCGMIAIWTKSR
jgi:hypothetical protein